MGNKKNKQRRRQEFESRHIDQLYTDVRKRKTDVVTTTTGPNGTTDQYPYPFLTPSNAPSHSAELDEDVPGHGQHYCVPCGRYFISGAHLTKHEASKLHKRQAKLMHHGLRPHSFATAEAAANRGPPDNGRRLRPLQKRFLE